MVHDGLHGAHVQLHRSGIPTGQSRATGGTSGWRTGAGAAVSRSYATEGTYAVTLTVTDNAGATSTQTRNVTVVPQTVAMRIAYDQCGPMR